jgi:hypothetical protein
MAGLVLVGVMLAASGDCSSRPERCGMLDRGWPLGGI